MTKKSTLNEIFSFLKRDSLKTGLDSFLLAGLGNPGKEYDNNRHNIGFMVLNLFAKKYGEVFSKYEMQALIAKFHFDNNRLLLVKPQTFMNRSGKAIGGLVRYYKIPLDNLMVVYDDIAENKVTLFDKGIDRMAVLGEHMDFDNPNKFSFNHRTGDVLSPNIDWKEPLKLEIEHFVDCIRNGTQCLTGLEHAKRVVSVLCLASRETADQ